MVHAFCDTLVTTCASQFPRIRPVVAEPRGAAFASEAEGRREEEEEQDRSAARRKSPCAARWLPLALSGPGTAERGQLGHGHTGSQVLGMYCP